MKKKILFSVDNLKCGGIQKAFISLINNLNYDKYEVFILLRRKEGEWLSMLDPKAKIMDPPDYFFWLDLPKGKVVTCVKKLLNNPFILANFIYSIFHGVVIRNMTKERQYFWTKIRDKITNLEGIYDVAIDFSGTFRLFIADKVNAKTKLTWIHSDYRVYMRNKNIDRQYFNFYQNIICVSDTCKEIFDTEFPNYKDRSIVIDNIINKKQISSLAEEVVDFDDDFDGIKIVDVTRVVPGKNLELAIHTCKKLIEAGFKLKWYIIGTGSESRRLKKIVSQLELENNFIFLGLKANPYPYMKRADLFVHCSLFEGRSVAIDEALALSKTVVVTNYPTAKDQIQNGVNGLICENDIDSLYNTTIESLGNKSIQSNLHNYNIESSIKKIEIIFNE